MSQTLTSTNAIALTNESSKQEESENLPSLWDSLSADESKLYPQLDSSYFDGKDFGQLLDKEPSNPIDRMVKKYLDAEVKPYIRRKNLNKGDPIAPDKNAWEIGIKVKF